MKICNALRPVWTRFGHAQGRWVHKICKDGVNSSIRSNLGEIRLVSKIQILDAIFFRTISIPKVSKVSKVRVLTPLISPYPGAPRQVLMSVEKGPGGEKGDKESRKSRADRG